MFSDGSMEVYLSRYCRVFLLGWLEKMYVVIHPYRCIASCSVWQRFESGSVYWEPCIPSRKYQSDTVVEWPVKATEALNQGNILWRVSWGCGIHTEERPLHGLCSPELDPGVVSLPSPQRHAGGLSVSVPCVWALASVHTAGVSIALQATYPLWFSSNKKLTFYLSLL